MKVEITNNNKPKPEVNPSPRIPIIPSVPEIIPKPDRNKPEKPIPERLPSIAPELKPYKEIV